MSQNLSQIEFQNQEKVKIKSIRSEQKTLILTISFLFIFLFYFQGLVGLDHPVVRQRLVEANRQALLIVVKARRSIVELYLRRSYGLFLHRKKTYS